LEVWLKRQNTYLPSKCKALSSNRSTAKGHYQNNENTSQSIGNNYISGKRLVSRMHKLLQHNKKIKIKIKIAKTYKFFSKKKKAIKCL
jgi:hypothetical protein